MSIQQQITSILDQIPEDKLDTILTFVKFVAQESEIEINNAYLSEPSLAKDWLSDQEEQAWRNL